MLIFVATFTIKLLRITEAAYLTAYVSNNGENIQPGILHDQHTKSNTVVMIEVHIQLKKMFY